MQNAVYAYNPTNKRFSMQFEGEIYHFTFDHTKYAATAFWNEDSKFLARTYKGFRGKLGIEANSSRANSLIKTIMQAKDVKV